MLFQSFSISVLVSFINKLVSVERQDILKSYIEVLYHYNNYNN